jgi:hypothetical protein
MFTFEKLFKWILFQDVFWSTIHLRFFFCSVYDFIFVLSKGSDIYYYFFFLRKLAQIYLTAYKNAENKSRALAIII